jgi:predicted 3-demethylubiquinone-9 3-methyltransferase (glyoxalase superfamily)
MAVTPYLMFTGEAEEAMRFYISVLPGGELVEVERYGPDQDGAEGSIKRATFRISGQTFLCMDSPVKHDFGFTPSVSFLIDCTSESEFDTLSNTLSKDGKVFMPAGEYPFARRFTWLSDRYGVSWQLHLASARSDT